MVAHYLTSKGSFRSCKKLILIVFMLSLCLLVRQARIKFIKTGSRSEQGQPETIFYGKDNGCNNIKTKYRIHKLLEDNGPKLLAKQRAQLVRERCQTFVKENNLKLNLKVRCRFDDIAFIISRRYDLSICLNLKVASTNIKRVLYGLDHNFSLTNNISGETAGQFKRINFHRLLSNKRTISFMLVREPLERLLSAYLDKRGVPEKGFVYSDKSFTFKRFLKIILHSKMKQLNNHFFPYFEKCRPCEMEYDFIGLQNNFNDEIRTLLQQIDADVKIDIPDRNNTGYYSKSSDMLVKSYYKKVPNDIVHRLWAKYYKDYYIFGFPYPTHLMN